MIPASRRRSLVLVKEQRARRSTAALAVFLLFAAALLGIAPAEASIPRAGVADRIAHVVAGETSAPLELELTPAAPPIASSRFGFAESVSLLDVENAPGDFALFGAGSRRCEITYALNNPLRFVDPDGQATKLAEAVAGVFESAGAAISRAGASLNGGGAPGVAADTALSTLGGAVGGLGDMFRVGDSVGDAMGSGASGGDFAEAVRQDFVRGASLFVSIAAPVNAGYKALTTTMARFGAAEAEALSLRPDITLSGGRGGTNVKNLVGPPNSAVNGGPGRVFVTNNKGQVVSDITGARVKPVKPGVGFGKKTEVTPEDFDLLEKMRRLHGRDGGP